MASFTERATLEVKDKSTAQIRKINVELKKLQTTAKSIRSMRIEIRGIQTAISQVRQLTTALRGLKRISTQLNIRVNAQGLGTVQGQITRLRASARRPVVVNTRFTSSGQPGRPPGTPGRPGSGRGGGRARTFLGTAAQAFNAGAGGGMGLGLMGGLAAVNPGLLAVAAAAYAAAAALREIGSATIKADRADLMMKLASTPEQQGIINAAVAKYSTETTHPLAMTRAEMKAFIVGMLADVGGKTPVERATAAATIAPEIVDTFLPLAYGLGGPKMSRDEAMSGLNTIVKGLNIASGDLTNAAGKLTEDGRRVFEGVALAKATNPNLEAERIRSVLANLKTAAFALSPEALARVLSSGGDRGVRSGNELYMAIRGLSGIVDNKALNRALQGLGLLTGGKPALTPSGKLKRDGSIQPGTGTPIDSDLLRTNPYDWIIKHILPKVEERAKKSLTKSEIAAGEQRAAKVREEGGTEQEIAEARAPLRSRIQTMLEQLLPGMTATARTALAEAIFGEAQAKAGLSQGADALANLRNRGKEIFDASISAQLANLGATLTDKAAEMGQGAADAMGLTAALKQINDALRDPKGPARADLLEKFQKAFDLTPMGIAGKLMLEGGMLIYRAAAWMASWIPGGGPEKTATQSGISAVEAQSNQDASSLAAERVRIISLEDQLKNAQARLRNAPTKGKGAEKMRADITATITKLETDLEEARQNAAGLKAYLEERQKAKAEEYPSDFVGPLPPGAKKAEAATTTPEVQAMLAGINEAPGKFGTVFNTLPEKGGESGINFGTNSMININAGVYGAGVIMGNATVETVKAGLSQLNINANINVKGTEGGGDKGARPAD